MPPKEARASFVDRFGRVRAMRDEERATWRQCGATIDVGAERARQIYRRGVRIERMLNTRRAHGWLPTSPELPVRITNALINARLVDSWDFTPAQVADLWPRLVNGAKWNGIKNFGETSLRATRAWLEAHGYAPLPILPPAHPRA